MNPKTRDELKAKLEKKLAGDYIPLFGGRPIRSLIIGKDDFLDLKIFLNATSSVESFLARL